MIHYFLTLLAIVATFMVVLIIGLPFLLIVYYFKYIRK